MGCPLLHVKALVTPGHDGWFSVGLLWADPLSRRRPQNPGGGRAPSHSITSSARARSVGGIVRLVSRASNDLLGWTKPAPPPVWLYQPNGCHVSKTERSGFLSEDLFWFRIGPEAVTRRLLHDRGVG